MDEIEALILNAKIREERCPGCSDLLLKTEENTLAFSYTNSKWLHKTCAENLKKAIAFTLIVYFTPPSIIFEYHPKKETT